MNLKKFHQVKGTEWQDQNFHWDRSWDLFGLTFFSLILRLFLRPNFFRPIPINIETATMLVCLETRRHTLVCGKEAFFRHECMEERLKKNRTFYGQADRKGGDGHRALDGGQFHFWSNFKVRFMYTFGIYWSFGIFYPTFDEQKSRFRVQSSQKIDNKNRKNEKMPQNNQFWACFGEFE